MEKPNFDIESFVEKLISLDGRTPVWYWNLLDLARGEFSDMVFVRVKNIMKSNNFSGVDYMDATSAKKYLEMVELFLPLVIHNGQQGQLNRPTEQNYVEIIKIVPGFKNEKLQYDILTRIISRANPKTNVYVLSRVARSLCLYPEKVEINKDCTFVEKEQMLNTQLDDLRYFMMCVQGTNIRLNVATEMVRIGSMIVDGVAQAPHAYFGPNNEFSNKITSVVNNVRGAVAVGISNPSVQDFLYDKVYPVFSTEAVCRHVLKKTH